MPGQDSGQVVGREGELGTRIRPVFKRGDDRTQLRLGLVYCPSCFSVGGVVRFRWPGASGTASKKPIPPEVRIGVCGVERRLLADGVEAVQLSTASFDLAPDFHAESLQVRGAAVGLTGRSNAQANLNIEDGLENT